MTIALDLPTVLFVLQASYIASAVALAYARYRSCDAAGAEVVAVGFLVLALGAMIAGHAEIDRTHYAEFSLANITLGTLGYGLLLVGAVELSRRRRFRPRWIVLLPPILTVAIGLWTGFPSINWLRAMMFNITAATAMLASAWVFHRDGLTEPLPARRVVALSFSAAGAISLTMALEFALGRFWPSPVLAFVLLLALMFTVTLSVMILTMERAVAKFDRLAHTDMLTGLSNRRFFFDAVPANPGTGDAIVIFDADRFKKLNDTWGHAVGDDVLQATARALAANVRSGDILARYGGEEFILFLPAAGEAEALAVANRMRAAVASTVVDGATIRTTVSAGLAICPRAGTPLKELIREADAALYDAKAGGRNICRVSRPAEGHGDYAPAI